MNALGSAARFARMVLVAALLANVLAVLAGAADASAATEKPVKEWQHSIQELSLPSTGCFNASYPRVEWRKVACKAAPDRPDAPAVGPRPYNVGGAYGNYSAEAAGMKSATASVTFLTPGATEEEDGVANAFSLQLNSQEFFGATGCMTSKDPGCLGWEQFVYGADSNLAFIEYWLLAYHDGDEPCPMNWYPEGQACWTNSPLGNPSASELPDGPLTVSGLRDAKLTGTVNVSGGCGTPASCDTVVLTTTSPTGEATASGEADMLGLDHEWKSAEFAVVGEGGSQEAKFSPNTAMETQTETHNGTTTAPTCVLHQGYTAETNNLTLEGAPTLSNPSPHPTMAVKESNSPPSPNWMGCAVARGINDTHLLTFLNTLYDFQGEGDFEMTTAPEFSVQERQANAAANGYPNAAENTAVAAHIGDSNVAICTAPTRLLLNGRAVKLKNGGRRNLSDGDDITRHGNEYLFRGANGDSILAQVNTGSLDWINLYVGLGQWPLTVHGLLANAGESTTMLESRTGNVIDGVPFAFNQVYGEYGESWRVSGEEDLLSPCGGKVTTRKPKQPIYAKDLPKKVRKNARKVCLAAGVKAAPLLNACTVDVAVLRKKTAAQAYKAVPADVTWGQIAPPGEDEGPPLALKANHAVMPVGTTSFVELTLKINGADRYLGSYDGKLASNSRSQDEITASKPVEVNSCSAGAAISGTITKSVITNGGKLTVTASPDLALHTPGECTYETNKVESAYTIPGSAASTGLEAEATLSKTSPKTCPERREFESSGVGFGQNEPPTFPDFEMELL